MSDKLVTKKPKFRKRKKKNKNKTINTNQPKSIPIIIHSNYNTNNEFNIDSESKNNDISTTINDDKNSTNSKIKSKSKSKEDENEDEEDDDLDFLQNLKQKSKLQFQSNNKGLVFEESHDFTSSGLENPDNFKLNPTRDFDESFATEKAQDDILKHQRDEWVEEKMRKKLAEKGRVLPEKNKNKKINNPSTTLQEELYKLPSSLIKPIYSNIVHNTHHHSEEVGERWLAGMAEYELPIEYKLKNIEQTENAKKKLLIPKMKNEKIFSIPRNYNQDFTTHHYDRVKYSESKRKLQETKQKISMEKEKKRRRLMGPQFYE